MTPGQVLLRQVLGHAVRVGLTGKRNPCCADRGRQNKSVFAASGEMVYTNRLLNSASRCTMAVLQLQRPRHLPHVDTAVLRSATLGLPGASPPPPPHPQGPAITWRCAKPCVQDNGTHTLHDTTPLWPCVHSYVPLYTATSTRACGDMPPRCIPGLKAMLAHLRTIAASVASRPSVCPSASMMYQGLCTATASDSLG